MTTFQDRLLAELVTHVQEHPSDVSRVPNGTASNVLPADVEPPTVTRPVTPRPLGRAPRRRPTTRSRRRIAVAATAAIAAAVAGAVTWSTPSPAYAITDNDDGTVTVTFYRHPDADALNKDLRDAGVPAIVLDREPLPTCKNGDAGLKHWSGLPEIDPDTGKGAWRPGPTNPDGAGITLRPSAVPDGRVVVLWFTDQTWKRGSATASGRSVGIPLLNDDPTPQCFPDNRTIVDLQNAVG